jgi:hypothetical protein
MPFLDPEEFKPKLKEIFENVVIPQIKRANMKQTAVEWLIQALIMSEDSPNYNQWAIDKAKAMEKEQIINAFNQSWHDRMNPYKTADKYYNETFKSE